MKKLSLFICLAVLAFCHVKAQTYWDSSRPNHRFTFGVRAGCNVSKMYTEDQFDMDFGTSFQLGAIADINIIRSISMETGVYYIQKYPRFSLTSSNETMTIKMNPTYIEIPLLASYHIALSDNAQFLFNAGAYFAFGITGNNHEVFESLKKTDVGASLGGAITYRHYYFGINYERSMMNISKDVGQGVKDAQKEYFGSIVLSLGYNF